MHLTTVDMVDKRTITYDGLSAGRKIISFPVELPFSPVIQQIEKYYPKRGILDELRDMASQESIYSTMESLGEFLNRTESPEDVIMQIAAMALKGDTEGIRLLHSMLLVTPSIESLAGEFIDFKNVRRVMSERFGYQKAEDSEADGRYGWFKKKVLFLSTSFRLPNQGEENAETPWESWSDGVRIAMGSSDERWNDAVVERLKVELEAHLIRLTLLISSIDIESHPKLAASILSKVEATRWKLDGLKGGYLRFGSSTLLLAAKLRDRWSEIFDRLYEKEAGRMMVDLFRAQENKAHSIRDIVLGSSILYAILTHPILKRSSSKPDILSTMSIFIENSGEGKIEISFASSYGASRLKDLIAVQGFELDESLLVISLNEVPFELFVQEDWKPNDIKWSEVGKFENISYKTLVMTYMDNDNVLVELLNNPRVISKPGIVPLIASRCRSLRILSIVANRRDFYTGFANKSVPLNLLMNPAKIPLTALRKFIHVRYVDKMTLQRLATRGGQIREEVRREIQRYLSSLG